MSLRDTPENPEENAHSRGSAAPGAAVGAENTPVDANLQEIIEAWPTLTEETKAGIQDIVKDSRETEYSLTEGN